MNYTRRIIKANFGFFLCALGLYLTIQANIGLAPWDALAIGITIQTGVLYGTASIIVSTVVILIGLGLREKLGLGTILNTIVIAKLIDLFRYFDPVPMLHNFWAGLILLFVGQTILCFGCYYYISPGLGCGPRDTLMVALGKKINNFPIGIIKGIIEGGAMLSGWLLGAPVGLGTVICMFGVSFLMQFVFDLMKFDVKAVRHENIFETYHNIFGRGELKSGK